MQKMQNKMDQRRTTATLGKCPVMHSTVIMPPMARTNQLMGMTPMPGNARVLK